MTGVPGTTFNLAATRNVIHILQGEYDRVMDVLRPALEMDETQIVAELDRAARCVEQLLGKYDELKLRHFKPGILYLRARVSLAAGNNEAAYKTLCDALALSDEIGAHREVWEMWAALSKLEAQRGNPAAAIQSKERACNEVMLIAEHAGAPELREIFLSRPEVQTLIGV